MTKYFLIANNVLLKVVGLTCIPFSIPSLSLNLFSHL